MKNKVYLLNGFCYDDSEIIGIYTSYEKANIEKIKREKNATSCFYEILEMEVE